jgi:cell division protein FtsB
MLERRGRIEAIERAINTLSQGLEDLVEEATRFKKD